MGVARPLRPRPPWLQAWCMFLDNIVIRVFKRYVLRYLPARFASVTCDSRFSFSKLDTILTCASASDSVKQCYLACKFLGYTFCHNIFQIPIFQLQLT